MGGPAPIGTWLGPGAVIARLRVQARYRASNALTCRRAGAAAERTSHSDCASPRGNAHSREASRNFAEKPHRVQPRRRQTLLATGPPRSVLQQRMEPLPDLVPRRPGTRRPLHPRRRLLRRVPPHRVAGDPHLPRHPTGRTPLHQNLVPDHMYLIHPQHPPRGPTRDMGAGVDQFPSGVWITFRAAASTISPRCTVTASARSATAGGATRSLGAGADLAPFARHEGASHHVSQRVLQARRLSL
jgi:hypothetical protein